MDEKQLLALKEKINAAKDEVAELKGQEKYLMKELKENWNCSTVKEAETALQKLEENIEETNQKIGEAVQELKEKYNYADEKIRFS